MVIVSGTWSTTGVNALLAGLIGVAATLLGSFTTYLFQSRTAERAQSFERDERLRYEQVNACSAFASAMTELKRGLITLWFYHQRDAAGADYLAARIECDRLGASAEAAQFRVQLVSETPRWRCWQMLPSPRSATSAVLLTAMNCANATTTSKPPSRCSFTPPLDSSARPLQHRRQADLAKMHQRPLHSNVALNSSTCHLSCSPRRRSAAHMAAAMGGRWAFGTRHLRSADRRSLCRRLYVAVRPWPRRPPRSLPIGLARAGRCGAWVIGAGGLLAEYSRLIR